MAASIGLFNVRILIFKLLYLSYFIPDFDLACGRLHSLIRACMSDSHAYKVAVPLKLNIIFKGSTFIENKNFHLTPIISHYD